MISRNHTVWRRTERLCRCAGLACAAALAWAALASAARAQEALKFSAPLAINRVSVRCGNPVMAAGRDGVAFAVWDGYDGRGARHVWFAQRAASGQWSEEIALSAAVSGDNCEPSLAVDPKGYPHVVWRARIDGVGQIYYTRRKGDDEPVDEAEILRWSIPNRLDRVEGLNCESARLAFDGEGRPHALWQAGLGSRYAIYAAWAPFKGRWRDFCLSGAGEGAAYCFLPQLVRGGPDILAVWVEADFEGLGLRLRAARAPQTARDAWTPAELASLAGLPADRLPTLLSDVGGRVWALWSDLNGGRLLVAHDITHDLYRQVYERNRSLGAWWHWWRWRRFELAAVKRYQRVIVMSAKDRELLGARHAVAIGNGVDLERFAPGPETAGQRLLFIGSFRHFPNITAYRFFSEQVWPLLADRFPGMTVTVVAGPDPMLYWSGPPPARPERIRLLEFVRDVRPLYLEANIVIVPTLVSAGTNLKVLEAMAMERALVTTPSGCAGLGLVHGESAWIAEGAEEFAGGVAALAQDPARRRKLAAAARRIAEEHYGWRALGELQRQTVRELLGPPCVIRAGREEDLESIAQIQQASPLAAQWPPRNYLAYDVQVALAGGRVAGFLVCRDTAPGEAEVLNLAVAPEYRRRGIASALLATARERHPGELFLEVRESNAPAQALYGKLGFTIAGRRPGYYADPPETAVVMRLARSPRGSQVPGSR